MEHVILVDEDDSAIGTMEKMEAHRKGLLHRAFSILLFNSKGELLIQKRAASKYHSGGLWTNTCCSHPLPGESLPLATSRRLKYEMGIVLQPDFAYKFIYKAKLDKDIIEHEMDYVFTGTYNGKPEVNPQEVEDWKFINMKVLKADVQAYPEKYTIWFRVILNRPEISQLVT
jgi:isopentenyl-diphosphate Delta-isomerase